MRIYATDLDKWRWWTMQANRDGADLLDDLTTVRETYAMRVGSAFHHLMECRQNDSVDAHFIMGPHRGRHWRFDFAVDARTVAVAERERRYSLALAGIDVGCRVDGRIGDMIVDYKVTTAPIKPWRHFDSWQWRVYLLATGARLMRYEIYMVTRRTATRYRVSDAQTITMTAYPDMRADVSDALRKFGSVARHIGWAGRPYRRHEN